MNNRIQKLVPLANSGPDKNMRVLLNNLGPSTIVPDQDKYYVFVYKAKTRGIVYDKYPFIMCSSLFKWGFIGFNFHWNEYRRYTWKEVISNLYEIYDSELNTMESYPIAKFISN